METTKKNSPFTHFDSDYYNNLRLLDVSKAEAYRKQMTAPLQGSRNLSHEKYADQKLQSEIAKDINFVKDYAKKNKMSQEQAIIAIRQGYIDSINKVKIYKPTEEEAKQLLLQKQKSDDLLEGTDEIDDTNKASLPDLQVSNVTGTATIDDANKGILEENSNANGLAVGSSYTDPIIPADPIKEIDKYVDINKKDILNMIKELDPEAPVNDRTNKDTLVKTYEELLSIKNEQTK